MFIDKSTHREIEEHMHRQILVIHVDLACIMIAEAWKMEKMAR